MNPTVLGLLIGAVSGVVAALCGVGGGIVMVPAFVGLLKMDQKGAVATSLAAIIFTAVVTSLKNHSNDLINWKLALGAGGAGALVGWFAADFLKEFRDVTLTRIFATVIIVVGIQMWWTSTKKEPFSVKAESAVPDNNKRD